MCDERAPGRGLPLRLGLRQGEIVAGRRAAETTVISVARRAGGNVSGAEGQDYAQVKARAPRPSDADVRTASAL